MNDLSGCTGGVRSQVALATREIHDRLHHDALLGRLVRPDVTLASYRLALQVFLAFYREVERERTRLHRWETLSLEDLCQSLEADVGPLTVPGPKLEFASEEALLGGLYVVHGASFGRASFRANIARALPAARQSFINRKMDKAVWQGLIRLMDKRGRTPDAIGEIRNGAAQSFARVAMLSSFFTRQE